MLINATLPLNSLEEWQQGVQIEVLFILKASWEGAHNVFSQRGTNLNTNTVSVAPLLQCHKEQEVVVGGPSKTNLSRLLWDHE